jgi:hypothetical protein
MDKELPYFKFFPGKYTTGDIFCIFAISEHPKHE